MSAHLDDDDLPPQVSDDKPDSFTVVAQARRFRKRLETQGNAHELVKTMDEALEELGDLSSSVIEPFITEVIAASPLNQATAKSSVDRLKSAEASLARSIRILLKAVRQLNVVLEVVRDNDDLPGDDPTTGGGR